MMSAFFSNGATIIIVVLLVLAIAYRYYSAFIAAKVLALDDRRPTPAHALKDGHNYHPTNKWVLFGHHFAAISGAGPLIGPVLAAQFGYLPGLIWILVGVCLAGAVQDFVILAMSIRRQGKSLAQIAFSEIGSASGTAATIGILFVLVIALAGLGKVVTKALGGDIMPYPTGTEFVGSPSNPITRQDQYDNTYIYRIPAGAEIRFKGGSVPVTSLLRLEATPKSGGAPLEIDDTGAYLTRSQTRPAATTPAGIRDLFARASTQPRPTGLHLTVTPDVTAKTIIDGSSWGTFTIFLTIPIAFFVGIYLYRIRKGRVLEASIIGGLLTLLAVYLGGVMSTEGTFLNLYRDMFNLTEGQIGFSMLVYGFVASILPVWMLLCPRDYLSSFLKIGTVILLVVGVIVAHPHLRAEAINPTFLHEGPVVAGPIYPFLFITIMCGAISGFHALVSSGTTPKMIGKETDARTIGYGAMLIEGLVGIVAMIAAAALPPLDYYNINTATADLPKYVTQIQEIAARDRAARIDEPPEPPLPDVGEHVQGRTGGAVTLALGMAHVFDTATRNILGTRDKAPAWLLDAFKYWYHFAIMFEALFILTTIDTGTRVGRFLLQETMGKWLHPKLAQTDWWPSAIISTAVISLSWWYFLSANAFPAIWSMFGIANQMLAVIALAVASAVLARSGKRRYLAVTLVPMIIVALTTGSAAFVLLTKYVTRIRHLGPGESPLNPYISAICVLIILACTAVIVVGALRTLSKPVNPESPDLAPELAVAAPKTA
jgi:carbon starvation protein